MVTTALLYYHRLTSGETCLLVTVRKLNVKVADQCLHVIIPFAHQLERGVKCKIFNFDCTYINLLKWNGTTHCQTTGQLRK